MISNIAKRDDQYDEITISFISQSSGSKFSFLGGSTKEKWETWVLPLQLKEEGKDESKKDIETQTFD